MRKAKVITLVLSFVLMLSLVACGGGGVKTGKYALKSMTMDGQDYLAMLQGLAALTGQELGDLGSLEIKDDKNAVMVSADGETTQLTYDDKYFMSADGQKMEYKASGSSITFTYSQEGHSVEMVFKK